MTKHILRSLEVFDETKMGYYDGGFWIGVDHPEWGQLSFAQVRYGCEEAEDLLSHAQMCKLAHQFAAAPELLEVAKEAKRVLGIQHPYENKDEMPPVYYALCQVIAKAEGKEHE